MVRVKGEVVVMARANAMVRDKDGAAVWARGSVTARARDKVEVVTWGRDEACGMEADSAFTAMMKVGKNEAKANAARRISPVSFLKRTYL